MHESKRFSSLVRQKLGSGVTNIYSSSTAEFGTCVKIDRLAIYIHSNEIHNVVALIVY